MRKAIITLTFCLIYVTVFCQYPDWKYFSTGQFINSIAQEGNFIWIANYAGATKLDTVSKQKTFFNTTNCPFKSNRISKVLVDHQNRKWFVSDYMNLLRLDSSGWSVFDTSNAPVAATGIGSIAIDSVNNLWITSALNVLRFDGITWTVFDTIATGIPASGPRNIFVDHLNRIIITNPGMGIFIYDGAGWSNIDPSNFGIPNPANFIDEDSNGNLWFSTYGGILKYDGTTFHFYNVPIGTSSSILALTVDNTNNVWIASGTSMPCCLGTVARFNGASWTVFDSSNSPFNETYFANLFTDSNNNVWAGGSTGELIKFSNNITSLYDISSSIIHHFEIKQVQCNRSSGVNYFCTATHYSLPENYNISSFDGTNWSNVGAYSYYSLGFRANNSGNVFVKNTDSIRVYSPSSYSSFPSPNLSMPGQYSATCTSMDVDTQNNYWADYIAFINVVNGIPDFREGIAKYDGTGWTLFSSQNSSLPDRLISDIKINNNNEVWVANNFISYYNGSTWINFDASNSPLDGFAVKVVFDSNNNVWTTGYNHSLFKYDGSTWTHFPNTIPFGMGRFSDIAVDIDNTVWGVISNSLFHFDGINWSVFNHTNSPLENFPFCRVIDIDAYGHKFIGTDEGIFVYRQGGIILSDNNIKSGRENRISIFPNPTFGKLIIQPSLEKISYISVANLSGQNIFKKDVGKNLNANIEVDLSNQSKGIYLIQVITDKSVTNQKIILE